MFYFVLFAIYIDRHSSAVGSCVCFVPPCFSSRLRRLSHLTV